MIIYAGNLYMTDEEFANALVTDPTMRPLMKTIREAADRVIDPRISAIIDGEVAKLDMNYVDAVLFVEQIKADLSQPIAAQAQKPAIEKIIFTIKNFWSHLWKRLRIEASRS